MPKLADVLRRRCLDLALVDQSWLPRPAEWFTRFDPVATDFAYIRFITLLSPAAYSHLVPASTVSQPRAVQPRHTKRLVPACFRRGRRGDSRRCSAWIFGSFTRRRLVCSGANRYASCAETSLRRMSSAKLKPAGAAHARGATGRSCRMRPIAVAGCLEAETRRQMNRKRCHRAETEERRGYR